MEGKESFDLLKKIEKREIKKLLQKIVKFLPEVQVLLKKRNDGLSSSISKSFLDFLRNKQKFVEDKIQENSSGFKIRNNSISLENFATISTETEEKRYKFRKLERINKISKQEEVIFSNSIESELCSIDKFAFSIMINQFFDELIQRMSKERDMKYDVESLGKSIVEVNLMDLVKEMKNFLSKVDTFNILLSQILGKTKREVKEINEIAESTLQNLNEHKVDLERMIQLKKKKRKEYQSDKKRMIKELNEVIEKYFVGIMKRSFDAQKTQFRFKLKDLEDNQKFVELKLETKIKKKKRELDQLSHQLIKLKTLQEKKKEKKE